MEYISTCKREFKPQTKFQYSCLNYITLQHIIETITGQSLRDFAKENIFDILGMQYTDYLPTIQQQDGKWINTVACPWMDWIAPTEKQKDGSVLCGQVHDPLARILNGGISGNAGIFSNANDIGILAAALLNGGEYNGRRILSPLGVKTMCTVPRELTAFGRTPGWDIFLLMPQTRVIFSVRISLAIQDIQELPSSSIRTTTRPSFCWLTLFIRKTGIA